MKAARSAGVTFSTGRLMAEAAVRDEDGSRGVRQTVRKLDSIVLAPGNSTKRLTTGLDTTRDSEELTEQGCNALVGSHVACWGPPLCWRCRERGFGGRRVVASFFSLGLPNGRVLLGP